MNCLELVELQALTVVRSDSQSLDVVIVCHVHGVNAEVEIQIAGVFGLV